MPTFLDSSQETGFSRLFEIKREDEDYLVSQAKNKGYEDGYIYSLYVVAVANIPLPAKEMGIDDVGDKFIIYSEDELRKMSEEIDMFFYDDRNSRLMGFIPPTKIIFGLNENEK